MVVNECKLPHAEAAHAARPEKVAVWATQLAAGHGWPSILVKPREDRMALPQDIRPVNNELADSITRSSETCLSNSSTRNTRT